MAILELKELVVDYGIIRALKGVNMKVEEGTIVAVLGANGAGKTTAIRTISGLVKAKSGSILLNEVDIKNLDPSKIAKMGVLQSPEGRLILNGLTVEQNLRVGAYGLKSRKTSILKNDVMTEIRESAAKQIKNNLNEVYQYFPILKERKNQQASTLSGGEQQMLAIGRALMGSPKILLLDEPSLGLAPLIVRDIFNIINEIKKRGTTILIVEQNAYQTLKIADYAYILELGKIKTEGKGQDLLKDKSLVEAYLGENH
ncbi:MAG: ABC transporter ATP-binding protein [Acholeplasmataceae bacterium]|nr:ABC transporter ATP-binding protein [Acholeplasmataceae bacterium]